MHVNDTWMFYLNNYGNRNIVVSPEASHETIEKDKLRVDSIFNSLPYEVYPPYKDCKISELVNNTVSLINCKMKLNESIINIRITVMMPETIYDHSVTFKQIIIDYDYELKLNDDVEYLIDLINIDKEYFVNTEGFLDAATLREFSWRLSDLSIVSYSKSISKSDLPNISIANFFAY